MAVIPIISRSPGVNSRLRLGPWEAPNVPSESAVIVVGFRSRARKNRRSGPTQQNLDVKQGAEQVPV
jgi:hypothetical protein